MKPEVFVSKVRSAIQQDAADRRSLLESTTPDGARDPYWKRALTLHRSLSDADRTVLLQVMRQVAVDTVSHLFGILDGSSPLEGSREEFVLTSQPDNRKLNGDLQDLYLEVEERERR